MDLHFKLKQATHAQHRAMESSPIFKKIVENTLTLDDYKFLLHKFYGYIQPCEKIIANTTHHATFNGREKTRLLEQDLQTTGTRQPFTSISQCRNLPQLDEYEKVLGYFYVLEGATLGGQIISRILTTRLNLTQPSLYFNAYGKETESRWRDFCGILNVIKKPHEQDKVISSALLTYTTLYNWFTTYE